ncbi:extracellular solute-binding protein [Bacillus sp. SD088]|uniref:extracellular solute-binding protein n=1 Tax=Bacillus sp. SD088 TaxID=2782012 RepID=UPI001A9742A8|nr:extracellular solute-binding protein [Bacillus sp. SD088]MBO0991660.1 extracellular solute-binding protein [Bacillus sp. SD088]
MKIKIFLFGWVVLLVLLASCSNNVEKDNGKVDEEALKNVNETGFPIVEEPITLKMFTGKSAQNANSDWNDILIWNKYSEMTNIELNWEQQIQTDSLEEKRNLALAGGNLPDVFFLSSMPTLDLYKYGKQGTFVKLNDLIDQYAPNLNKLMEENPEIKKGITFPDGNIYSLPSLVSPDFLSVRVASRPWFSKEVLNDVGMEVPETTDEFYQFLKDAKEKTDKVPYGGTSMDELVGWLEGSFGVANRGVRNENIDVDPNDPDKVRFYTTSDDYKALLEYMHTLYSEKLIEQNIFSIEWGQYLGNAAEKKYASTVFYDPVELFGKEVGSDYDSAAALKGPNGNQSFTKVAPMVSSIGSFVITKENPNPAATVRWMDYFYSDEGARLYYMGVEGETYEKTADGKYEYVDKIKNPAEGLTMEQEIAKHLTWLGGVQGIIKEDYFQGSENAPASLEAAKKIEPYVADEIWPAFLYTEEENKFLASAGTDISKYVTEMTDKFISGDEPLSKWDEYVKTIETMGLDKYMEIQQAAYDRYKKE